MQRKGLREGEGEVVSGSLARRILLLGMGSQLQISRVLAGEALLLHYL